MIERFVMLKLTAEHANPEGRVAVAQSAREVLPGVPGIRSVKTGLPADEKTTGSWDVALLVRFERIEDVAPYIAHPVHRAWVDDYLKPRLECIKTWNFER